MNTPLDRQISAQTLLTLVIPRWKKSPRHDKTDKTQKITLKRKIHTENGILIKRNFKSRKRKNSGSTVPNGDPIDIHEHIQTSRIYFTSG